MVLGGVSHEYSRHAGVETAAEDGCQPCLLEALAVSPLPGIFEMGLFLGLIVGGVEIVDAAFQASLHDSEILVGERYVDADVGFVTVEELDDFLDVVGIHAVGRDVEGADFCGEPVALLLCARRDNDFREYIWILSAFVGDDSADASGSDNQNFTHFYSFRIYSFVNRLPRRGPAGLSIPDGCGGNIHANIVKKRLIQ